MHLLGLKTLDDCDLFKLCGAKQDKKDNTASISQTSFTCYLRINAVITEIERNKSSYKIEQI